MRFLRAIPLLAVLLALTGCSTSPEQEKVSTGSIQARTFSFINPGSRPAPEGTDNRESAHRMIQGAIAQNLAGKGMTKTSAGGDVTVAYLVIVGTHTSTEAVSDYFGYSEDADKLHMKAHDAYTGNANRSYFEAGTLVIDVLDGKTNKLLKRNFATRPRLRNLPAEERSAGIQEVVDSILQDLRITQ
jgi:Domain of unknown function (DUF4136)